MNVRDLAEATCTGPAEGGRACAQTYVLLLAQDTHIRIVSAAIGELLRELILDPAHLPAHRQPRRPARTRPPKTGDPKP